MNPNRVVSLNEISNEFSVEELEPRMEMQMLGLGADPRIWIPSLSGTGLSLWWWTTPGGMLVI